MQGPRAAARKVSTQPSMRLPLPEALLPAQVVTHINIAAARYREVRSLVAIGTKPSGSPSITPSLLIRTSRTTM
jgi:hypothetical protein